MTEFAEIAASVQALVANAQRLGLIWQRRIATVIDGSSIRAILVQFDGDAASVGPIYSMIGPVANGARVYIDYVPPVGSYIVGYVTNPLGVDAQTFPVGSTPNWVKPSGAHITYAQVQASGGAGGGAALNIAGASSMGGGGGGGEYVEQWYDSTTLADIVALVIPAGGTGVSAGTGNPGATASFGTLTALGGDGGPSRATSATSFGINGSIGGTGGTGGGSMRVSGNAGGDGWGTASLGISGQGGGSHMGGGARGLRTISQPSSNAGQTGGNYGGGGGGALTAGTGAAVAGGAGGPGIIVVTSFIGI